MMDTWKISSIKSLIMVTQNKGTKRKKRQSLGLFTMKGCITTTKKVQSLFGNTTTVPKYNTR
jgi:hypothetical protein